MNRKEQYLQALQSVSMDKKIRSIKALEAKGWLREDTLYISNSIDSITKTLEEVYPGDWDVIVSKNYSHEYRRLGWNRDIPFRVEFVIRFNELIITNRDDLRHTLRGFYIKLEPTQDDRENLTFHSFTGKRMIATKEEIFSNYQHSHISGRQYTYNSDGDSAFNWRGFCTGSSQINQALSMLNSRYEPGRFKLFLLQLEEYLNYESIEGNPYMYIANVLGGGKLNTLESSILKQYYEELLLFRENSPKTIDFKLEAGNIRIIDNDNLEQYLKTYSNPNLYPHNRLAHKDERGIYSNYRIMPQTLPYVLEENDYEKIEFFFRGEVVSFIIKEQSEEDREIRPFFINKHIKNYVKTRIEQKIQTKRFSSYIIEQLNTPAYLTRHAKSNPVPVPEN